MRVSHRILTGIALLLYSGACGPSQETAIPDDRIGLVDADIGDTPTPPAFEDNTTEPGEMPVRPPVYLGSPPVVPHGIADFLPITREQNFCMDCHQVAEKVEGEPTPIPPSHYVDLRNAPDLSQDEVVGARFRCTACHVSQTDAPPLVGNRFAKED
jgi:cytochrome c-type protein NapB